MTMDLSDILHIEIFPCLPTEVRAINRDNNKQSGALESESDAKSVKRSRSLCPEEFSLHPHQIERDGLRNKSVELSTDFGSPGSSDFVPPPS